MTPFASNPGKDPNLLSLISKARNQTELRWIRAVNNASEQINRFRTDVGLEIDLLGLSGTPEAILVLHHKTIAALDNAVTAIDNLKQTTYSESDKAALARLVIESEKRSKS
jgi:hypothetical protein